MTKNKRKYLNISAKLYEKLSKHIKIINLKTKKTKTEWVIEAIEEAIKAGHPKTLPLKSLNVSIPEEIDIQIQERVNEITPLVKSYSSQKWIIDAIEEKIKSEEKNISEIISDLK